MLSIVFFPYYDGIYDIANHYEKDMTLNFDIRKKSLRIGILTVPLIKSGIVPLLNLVEIISQCSNKTFLITGNEGYSAFKNDPRVQCHGITTAVKPKTLLKIIYFLRVQFIQSYQVAKLSKQVDLWIFFLGEERQIIPLITAKLFGKKVILSSSGSSIICADTTNDPYRYFIRFFSHFCYYFSDAIIIYSERFIPLLGIQDIKRKIFIAHENFIDPTRFFLSCDISQRNNIIGFMGRFSPEKGILNFIEAANILHEHNPDIQFLIVGDGDQSEVLVNYIHSHNLDRNITLMEWVPHKSLPDILNQLKLLVIPSYSEGLPNIMLEAMACGTPVLASAVGAIPDVIIDQKSGFLLEDNAPDNIARKIHEIVSEYCLDDISTNERNTIHKDFLLAKTAEKYSSIIMKVLSS
jgi:glycosyltransferase involved in cell wall biosynthesis